MRWTVTIPTPHYLHGVWPFTSKGGAQGFINDRAAAAKRLGYPPLFLTPERK